jgi:ATP/maltotriose-dependent transcriptional regulator MalT
LLWRHAATEAALDRFTAAMSRADLPEVRRANLTVEADVPRAVAETHADRIEALGVGAKIKAAQGDSDAAASRLDEGMAVAEKLRLPRLAAAINHERVRLRLPITSSEAARLRAERTIPHADDGIATITAELDEASGIRLLARSDDRDDRDRACRRAEALLAGIDPIA